MEGVSNLSKSQSDVRQEFIRANPGVQIEGYPGYWYRCANCGKWCGRPGRSGVVIPDDMKMEVDHIKPWSQGGSDEIWNLQPLCKPCNRYKSANPSLVDTVNIVKNDIVHGDIVSGLIKKGIRQNDLLRALGLNKRK